MSSTNVGLSLVVLRNIPLFLGLFFVENFPDTLYLAR